MMTEEKKALSLAQAFRYPFQGQNWFRRIFVLALIQLIPIIGQLILIGYGLEVVRSVRTGRTDLPSVYWWRALREGGLIVAAGLLYCVPLLMVIPMSLTLGTSVPNATSNGDNGNVIRVLVTIAITLVISALAGRLRIENKKARSLMTGLVAIVPVLAVVSMLANVRSLVGNPSTGIASLNGIGGLLLSALTLLVLLMVVGLLVGAVRYAVENRGLFDPTGTARLLLTHRNLTGTLILHLAFLGLIAVLTISVGLVLLILPGLFATVCCSLALWYPLACFSMEAGFDTSAIMNLSRA